MSNESPFINESNNPAPTPQPAAPPKKKRGFASMNPEQVRELARRGGVAAHRAGTAHEFSSDEARAAGRKGGLAAHAAHKHQQPSTPPPEPENKTN